MEHQLQSIEIGTEYDPMEKSEWSIKDLATLEWATTKIEEARKRRDLGVVNAERKIADLKAYIEKAEQDYQNDTIYLQSKVLEYLDLLPMKETKTQKTITFDFAKMVIKKGKVKVEADKQAKIDLLETVSNDFVKTEKSLKWGEYSKVLEIKETDEGYVVIDTTTGEIVPQIQVIRTVDELQIKEV